MILEQHYLGCLAQASYLIADVDAGVAAVVDPRRDVDLYESRAQELGVRITDVFLTHFHADFLAGHLELTQRTGATLHLGSRAKADYDFGALADGDEVVLGSLRMRCLETPGHTPESVCYLVFEEDADEPRAVMTGDTLFIGDVGRPDLMASKGHTREELAGWLYDSTRTKLLTLPDGTELYPGHGAGSACGKNLSTKTVSSIGEQRADNYALQDMTREAFIETVTTGLVPPPAYFPVTAGLNKTTHAPLDAVLERGLIPLSLDEVFATANSGATILDVRPAEAYAASHLSGSTWVGLEGNFASWAGAVLDLERPVVLVGDVGQEREAALRLGRIGFDQVRGFLAGGSDAWEGANEALRTTQRMGSVAAREAGASDQPRNILDVRQPGEFETEHMDGATSIPLGQLRTRMNEVPETTNLLVHCKTGYRSLVAQSLLERAGREGSVDLIGGIDAWIEDGGPVVNAGPCSVDANARTT
jgi:hydroxyacylglutathione hydrolase